MIANILEQLGLSPNEAKVYEALVSFGGSSVSTISLRAKVNRSNTYETLYRLIEKGLVYEVFIDKDTKYEAVDPDKLMELITEKQTKLEQVLPHLRSLHTKHLAVERVYIFKGIEGVKNYLREALRVGEDIYSFAAKGAWFDERLQPFTQHFLEEAKRRGIQYHHIFDYQVQEKLSVLPSIVGKPYKFLPKEFPSDSTMDIFGDHIVVFNGLDVGTLNDDITIFVIVSAGLAESYRTWWKCVWSLLPEPKE
jgi:sugar-specific transcriptional regulator TrmB